MWTDVVDLRDFYATSPGRMARRLLNRRLRAIWPDLTGQRVLGHAHAQFDLSGRIEKFLVFVRNHYDRLNEFPQCARITVGQQNFRASVFERIARGTDNYAPKVITERLDGNKDLDQPNYTVAWTDKGPYASADTTG